MGLEAALERPGNVLGTLVVAKDEAEVAGRAPPSDCLPERIRDQLLGLRPDIDQPTTFLRDASITAARQGRPSPVPMQVMSPAHSLLRASTSSALSTRLARPGSSILLRSFAIS